MAKKPKSVGPITAEAELLEEAADTKLRAAQKMAKANAMLETDNEEEAPPEPLRPSFTYTPESQVPEIPTRIEQIIAEMKGEGKVSVSKLVGGTKSKIGVYPIEEYPEIMETIAHEHGGGTYRIQFHDAEGHYVISDTQTFDPKAYGSGNTATRREDSTLLTSLMERMEKKEEAADRRMEAMRQENMKLLLSIVEGSRSTKTSTSEMIEMMKFMKEAQGETRSPMDHIKDVLELANVVREEAGAVEPEHPLVAAIDKIFKTISPLIGAWAAKAGATPSGLPRPAVAPAQITSTPPKPESLLAPAPTPSPVAAPVVAVVDPRVKQYAASLLSQVDSGATAEAIGEAILNLTPEANYDELDSMVSNPQFVATLIDAEPLLAKHQRWLAELSVYITNQLTAEPDQPPAPAPAPASAPAEPAPVEAVVAEAPPGIPT